MTICVSAIAFLGEVQLFQCVFEYKAYLLVNKQILFTIFKRFEVTKIFLQKR